MDGQAIATTLEQLAVTSDQLPVIEVFEEIDSTNALLGERFAEQASMPRVAIAKRQMADFGGMIAFELKGGIQAGMDLIRGLDLIHCAVSLGNCETLIQHPASMTHSTYAPEDRAKHGISDGLVRLSIGLEAPEDLIADLGQALR